MNLYNKDAELDEKDDLIWVVVVVKVSANVYYCQQGWQILIFPYSNVEEKNAQDRYHYEPPLKRKTCQICDEYLQ